MKNTLQTHLREKVSILIKKVSYFVLVKYYKMDIHKTAKLDKTNPRGITIGEKSYITKGATIFAHDLTRLYRTSTIVGKYCFVGVNAIIMPGVKIGDHSIVGAGSVVTKDVPPNSIIVACNPSKVIRRGIETTEYGVLKEYALKAKKTIKGV